MLRKQGCVGATLLAVVAALVVAGPSRAATSFDVDYLDGVSGPQPAALLDLAGAWDFQVQQRTSCPAGSGIGIGPTAECVNVPAVGSGAIKIEVPGGGWVKQGFADVSEATYSRNITVPDIGAPQATKLFLGAVNHQATLTIAPVGGGASQTVGTNTTSWTPSVFDLTPYVKPGGSYTISLDVKGRYALRDPAGYFEVPEAASWSPNVAQGIFRSAKLEVFPAVYISDAFVRTSVADQTLSYDVTVTNTTAQDQTRELTGSLRSWNRSDWHYPEIPAREITVPAGQSQTFTVSGLPWLAPRESYWWPNVPYRRGYRAQLHDLSLSLRDTSSGDTARALVRFGFRELRQEGDHFELNGIRVNFRGDNIQTADYDSIDHGGLGDAIDTLPGFLRPSADNPGWPHVVDNYLRLNYNDIRVHQVPATPYMLDTADELGLMILDETAIRGSNAMENFLTGQANMVSHLQDLVLRDRNHASVLRWSESNEPGVFGSPAENVWSPGSGKSFNQLLYDTVMALDTTRPVSSDAGPGTTADDDLPEGNFTTWCHYYAADGSNARGVYTDESCKGVFLPNKPFGQGEFIWNVDNTKQGFEWFATATEKMREKGASDIRPYTLLSAWANLVPGVKTTDMTIEQGGPPLYGEDNLPDPWSNPQIRRVQKGFAPMLVADRDYWEANKMSNAAGDWPAAPVKLDRGTPTTRTLEIFNDTFTGRTVSVRWALHEGTPDGPIAAAHDLKVVVPLGQHAEQQITFTPPANDGPLYLVLSASKPGEGELFSDADTRFD